LLPVALELEAMRLGDRPGRQVVLEAGAPAPDAQLADRPGVVVLEERTGEDRAGLRLDALRLAGDPVRLRAGGGDGGGGLQLASAAGQAEGLVERAPRVGVAAAGAQLADDDQRRDPRRRALVVVREHGAGDLGRLVEAGLVEARARLVALHVGEP